MMFLDCPAYLGQDGTVRCGLPAEVRCRFTMSSTDGPLEGAMIRCPAGHWFNGPVESLTRESGNMHAPGAAGVASRARRDGLQRSQNGRDCGSRSAVQDFPAEPERKISRPNGAPAYYLGRPARQWITALGRSRTASSHPMRAVTGGRVETPPPCGGLFTGAGARTGRVAPATASWPRG